LAVPAKYKFPLILFCFLSIGIYVGWVAKAVKEYYKGPYQCHLRERALLGCEEVSKVVMKDAEQYKWESQNCEHRFQKYRDFYQLPDPTPPGVR
jgi:hypothetical protein